MAKGTRHFRIRDSRLSAAPSDVVMRRVLSPRTWPQWQSEILHVEGPDVMTRGAQVTGDARLLGFEVQGRTDAKEVTDDLFVEDVIVGVRMMVTYEVRPSSGGTIITRTLEADLPGGVSGRALSWMLRKRLAWMQKRLLRELSAQAEADASG